MNLFSYIILLIFSLLNFSISHISKIHIKKNHNKISSIQNKILFRNLTQTNILGNSSDINYYFTYLYLGESKQRQSYIIDTGSSITTSPCKPYCKNCGKHENNYYEINENQILNCDSSECANLRNNCVKDKCSFSISYSEGSSLKGIYSNQIVRLKNNDDDSDDEVGVVPIGCTMSETNLFVTQLADGIMGLSNEESNFINLLYKYNIIKNNIFSLCLSQNGGYFSISKIYSNFHLNSEINFIRLQNNHFFYISLKKIKINSIEKNIPNSISGFIDSGSTISYFPKNYSDFIIEQIKNSCEKNKCGQYKFFNDIGHCFIFENKKNLEITLKIWPNISFYLENNFVYVWTPFQYFFDYSYDNKIIGCIGYNSVNENRFTFGSTWMHGHDIIFDRSENKIGFVEADCDRGEKENFFNDDDKNLNNNLNNENNLNNNENNLNNENENIVKIKYFHYVYLSVIFVLIVIIFILGIAVFKLKKGKNFLCFYVENFGLNNMKSIRINNYDDKNVINDSNTKYQIVNDEKNVNNNNVVELIVERTNEKKKNNEEDENKNLNK